MIEFFLKMIFFFPSVTSIILLSIFYFVLSIRFRKSNQLSWWEYALLFIPNIIWVILIKTGVGARDFSVYLEAYVTAISVGIYLGFRLKYYLPVRFRVIINIGLLFLPLLIRNFFPLV